MNKKKLIIEAFENLDADMLDILLDDKRSYQDVPKRLFVARLKQYFEEMKNYPNLIFDFKAYPGTCNSCQKGKSGYSFVNSEGECFMSLIFEENETDITDIYKCSSFLQDKITIENDWIGIFFYDDEKSDFVHTSETLIEEKECSRAVYEIEKEIEINGILEYQFCNLWLEKYEHLDSIKRIFNNKNYSYALEVGNYLFPVSLFVNNCKNNNLAKSFLEEFLSFPVITEEAIKDWLIRADFEFQFAKYGFEYEVNFRQDFFEDKYFKYRLSECYYYQNISNILNNYFDWIPDKNPLRISTTDKPKFEDENEFPF